MPCPSQHQNILLPLPATYPFRLYCFYCVQHVGTLKKVGVASASGRKPHSRDCARQNFNSVAPACAHHYPPSSQHRRVIANLLLRGRRHSARTCSAARKLISACPISIISTYADVRLSAPTRVRIAYRYTPELPPTANLPPPPRVNSLRSSSRSFPPTPPSRPRMTTSRPAFLPPAPVRAPAPAHPRRNRSTTTCVAVASETAVARPPSRAEFARSPAVVDGLNADHVRELAALAVEYGTVTVRAQPPAALFPLPAVASNMFSFCRTT